MLLTLEVISANGMALGENRRKTVGPEGVRIGRSKENDWVINDQYISRVHAQVRCVGGAFYIEGMGRNPLAINDPNQTIPNNEPRLLHAGDHIFLDEYEIKVTLGGDAAQVTRAPVAPVVPDDPFQIEETARIQMSAQRPWGIVDGTTEESANLDPLAALGGGPSPRKEPPLPPVNIHQGSVLEENYRPPTPVATPTPPANKIPESWDRSGFTQMGQAQPATPTPTKKPVPPVQKPPAGIAAKVADSSIPDTWDKTRLTQIEQPPAAKPPPPPSPTQHQTAQKPVSSTAPKTMRRPVEPAPPVEQPVSRQAPPPPPPSAASSGSGSLGGDLDELLRAAGLTQISPEMARELGQVFRIVVQGVMEVLQSRAEIKSQLRMSMTRMQATENNPLKFSPNVEAALHTLLVERNRGYLPTVRAFQEAFTDIRNHQIAVLQGIRSAFDAMLENFDPERIEEELERGSKRGGLLNLGSKSRFRDHYVEQFANMTRDPDESFRRLFGEYFAQAYEEQMDRLKATGRTIGE